jgi:hypothetical protein
VKVVQLHEPVHLNNDHCEYTPA